VECDLPIASIGATVNDRGWCKTTALRFWGYSALATEIVCVLRYRRHHGPRTTLNLRAFNLAMFVELACGIDDATRMFHLQRGNYSRWFRDVIKDKDLATETVALEAASDANASRAAVADAIKRRYALSGLD
jgi:hypothetical protein